MLETAHGEFELIKNYRDAFILDDFNKRYLDVFNVFNDDTITSWGTRIGYDWYDDGSYPSTDGHELYGLSDPRQARVGLRLIF